MLNLCLGIIIIAASGVAFFFAWRKWKKGIDRSAVLLMMLAALMLRFFAAGDGVLHQWDERYHALVAKNLIKHPLHPTLYDQPVLPYDYTNWLGNHTWVHKQPLPLWTMAASMSAFGSNEIAFRLPSILLSTIGIALLYFIGLKLFNRKVALVAAFFYAIHGLMIELVAGRAETDHPDVFFAFFILLGVFMAVKYAERRLMIYSIICGSSIGLAMLCKWLPALIVVPVWVCLALDYQPRHYGRLVLSLFVLVVSAALIAMPWQLYIHHQFPLEASWESEYNTRHFFEALEDHSGDWTYYFHRLRISYGELVYLPIACFLFIAVRKRDWSLLAVSIWLVVPLLFFTLAKTKMLSYLLFAAPAIFLMTGHFFWEIQERAKGKYRWATGLVQLLLIALPIRYCIERVKPFQMLDRSPQWSAKLRELDKMKIDKGILFNYYKPIEAMFYTDLIAYSVLSDIALIDSLQKEGFTVLVNNNSRLTDEVRMKQGVKVVSLSDEVSDN